MQALYRQVTSRVLKDYPSVIVFDPAKVLCPDGECTIDSSRPLMWMDDNHLSESASYLQGESLFLLLKQVL